MNGFRRRPNPARFSKPSRKRDASRKPPGTGRPGSTPAAGPWSSAGTAGEEGITVLRRPPSPPERAPATRIPGELHRFVTNVQAGACDPLRRRAPTATVRTANVSRRRCARISGRRRIRRPVCLTRLITAIPAELVVTPCGFARRRRHSMTAPPGEATAHEHLRYEDGFHGEPGT